MPEPTKHDFAEEVHIRLWPAVVLAAVQLGSIFGAARFASTNVQNVLCFGIIPQGAGLLLAAWWLALSRAPWRARILGVLLAIVILLWAVLLQESNGYLILMIAVPALTVGVVAALVVTSRMRWRARRWVVLGVMMALAVVFTGIRVDGLMGRMQPDWSWRWDSRAVTSEVPLPDLALAEPGGRADLPAELDPQDWPGFRGPARDNRVLGTTFPTDWSTDAPREVWRRRVGLGWSSFAAVGGYLFTQEQRGEEELVVCYRANTGEPVWVNRVTARFDSSMGVGPRATPTYHQGRLYTLGATGVLQCIDAATGETVWQRSLTEDTGAGIPGWGFASSPLVTDGAAIVFSGKTSGKAVMAYDLALGRPERFAALIALSTWLPDLVVNSLPASDERASLSTLLVHGTQDQRVAIESGRDAKAKLEALGIAPAWGEYDMGHEINQNALRDLLGWIAAGPFAPV